jgi:hypothetical protein
MSLESLTQPNPSKAPVNETRACLIQDTSTQFQARPGQSLEFLPVYFGTKLKFLQKADQEQSVCRDGKDLPCDSSMRKILIDYLIAVAHSFQLREETLYYGIKYMDLYVSKNPSLVKEMYQ